jgi:hypothetical protein
MDFAVATAAIKTRNVAVRAKPFMIGLLTLRQGNRRPASSFPANCMIFL